MPMSDRDLQLILDKFDNQSQDIRELRQDIQAVQADVVEIKVNHLPHLATDVALLQSNVESIQERNQENDRRRAEAQKIKEKGRWKLYAAIVTGLLGLLGAVASSIVF